jgi:hypothetical protein
MLIKVRLNRHRAHPSLDRRGGWLSVERGRLAMRRLAWHKAAAHTGRHTNQLIHPQMDVPGDG